MGNMSRTNYQKGADKERRIINHFKKNGCLAFRSAGSHSIIDVVVVEPNSKVIRLIQAKTTTKAGHKSKLYKPEKERILNEGNKLNGTYEVRFELWG